MKKLLGLLSILIVVVLNAATPPPVLPSSYVTMQLSDMYLGSEMDVVSTDPKKSYQHVTLNAVYSSTQHGWVNGAVATSWLSNHDLWQQAYGWRNEGVTNIWINYPASATPQVTTIYRDTLLHSAVTNSPGVYWDSDFVYDKLLPMAWLQGSEYSPLTIHYQDQWNTNTTTFTAGGWHEVGITVGGPGVSPLLEYRVTFTVTLNLYNKNAIMTSISTGGLRNWRSRTATFGANPNYLVIYGNNITRLASNKFAVWVRPGTLTKIVGFAQGSIPSPYGFWTWANIVVDQSRTIN
jgi:hypothetical protein